MSAIQYDVAIMGGGLAGSTLARQLLLKRPNIKIVVLEKDAAPLPAAAHKVGESTVEIGAHYLSNILNLKEYFQLNQLKKFGLRCYFDAASNKQLNQRLEFGGSRFLSVPTYQIDRGHLENHMRDILVEAGVEFLGSAKVKTCKIAPNSNCVGYLKDGVEQQLQARWLIDASGRRSILKKTLDLAVPVEHNCSSSWWRFDAKLDIDTWFAKDGDPFKSKDKSAAESMEAGRWFSTNHLMGKGYWVWIIPLRDHRTSIGIVYDETVHNSKSLKSFEECLSWLDQYEPACAEACRTNAPTLMDFKVMRKYAFDCKRVFSSDGWGLTGEAGVFLDPFYSPGTDFIGFSNTMLTDLIDRSLNGERIVRRTEVYNGVFKALFANSLRTYQLQYPIFGNPLVMPMKIVWDYVLYWSFMAPLLFHDLITDLDALLQIQPFVGEIEALNEKMQILFREWDKRARPSSAHGALDNSTNAFLRMLNAELVSNARPKGAEVQVFMNRSIQILRELAHDISEYAGVVTPVADGVTRNPDIIAELKPFLKTIHDCAYSDGAYA